MDLCSSICVLQESTIQPQEKGKKEGRERDWGKREKQRGKGRKDSKEE